MQLVYDQANNSWRNQDLSPEPVCLESSTLTTELSPPIMLHSSEEVCSKTLILDISYFIHIGMYSDGQLDSVMFNIIAFRTYMGLIYVTSLPNYLIVICTDIDSSLYPQS